MRPYADEADIAQIVDLLRACEEVDQLDQHTSQEDMRHMLAHPDIDPARDLALWHDAAHDLVGYAHLGISKELDEHGALDAHISFSVHPEVRGVGLEEAMLAWAETQARAAGQARGTAVHLSSGTRDIEHERRHLLERRGFTVARSFLRLVRSLREPVPEPQLPAGFTLRAMCSDDPPEHWVAMFNESFIDHWNHQPMTVEQLVYYNSEPTYRSDLDLIAVAPGGTFAAFCVCFIDPQENERTGRSEGWIGVLGTRRGYRKIGLGRAMLWAGMQKLKAEGMDTVLLGVDAQNPSGALRLYEAAGFRRKFASSVYSKALA
jgi:mycothiol synthase